MNKLMSPFYNWWWRNPSGTSIPDDPSSIDSDNILLLLDGDQDLDTTDWGNMGTAGSDLVFSSTTVIISNFLNGHTIVEFSGNDGGSKGSISVPVLDINTKDYTLYFVARQDGYFGNRYIIDDTVLTSRHVMRQNSSVQNYTITGANIPLPTKYTTGKWKILSTQIIDGVGNSSQWQYEDGTLSKVTGSFTTSADLTGLSLCGSLAGRYNAKMSIAYVMWREGADDDAQRTLIMDSMKKRFGL